IARRLQSHGRRAPLKIAVRVLLDMLAGLDYVHQAHEPDGRSLQLVHRDVTPGNVLVGYDGISRLADFGLAKSQLTEQLQLTATGMILGTPKFLAPEVAQGGEADARTDLYGLGAVMYRLLVGSGPHDGELHEVLDAVLRGPPRPLHEARADLPRWFTNHIAHLMDRNPDKRPISAREAGLRLVEEAQKNKAVVPRSEVGRWLRELFKDECPRQTEDFIRDQGVDISLVPAGSGTRVLKTTPMPLQGPVTYVAGSDEDLTLPPAEAANNANRSDSIGPTALGLLADPADVRQPDVRPDAPISVPRRAPMPKSLESTRINAEWLRPPSSKPEVAVIAVEATRSSKPIPIPELKSSEPKIKSSPTTPKITSAALPFSSRPSRPWAAMVLIALAASAGGAVGGFSFAKTFPVETRRFTLVERLGGLQQSIARMRAGGADVPYDISERVDGIRTALFTGQDLTSTQLEMQELELLVQSLH
ncbi:MAG: serine/threonine-protein kinase, partial [Myxococcota bacterium]